MGIFSNIMSKLVPGHAGATAATPNAASPAPAASNASDAGSALGASPPATAAMGAPQTTSQPTPTVDIEKVLNGLAQKHAEKLNWRTSIVDLMKLLDLDSSLAARKTLAGELHYSGDTNDSAAMNIWLHKEVMRQVAANGGKVPDDLKA